MIFDQAPVDRKVRVFSLSSSFIEQYEGHEPKWGYDGLGRFTYKRTYSRVLPDGTTEDWWQTCKRVVEGVYNTQKIHCRQFHLPWNEPKAQKSARSMFKRMWEFKFLPPGRGLWMMGTDVVYERGSAALNSCGFASTENIDVDFAAPFTFLMDMSMLGVGVGGDTRGKGKVKLRLPKVTDEPFIIEDSREGWVELIRVVLQSFVGKGRFPRVIDFKNVRKRGEPLKTFGGTSSGPGPLVNLVINLTNLLAPEGVELSFNVGDCDDPHGPVLLIEGDVGEIRPYPISSGQIVDVFNYIGKAVVAGGIRRSSEIMFGDPDDTEFIMLKQDKAALEDRRWVSNNSIYGKIGMDYTEVAKAVAKNGEPGIFWLDNSRAYSRMGDPPDHKDRRVLGTNPCFTGDTLIAVADGRGAVPIKQLADEGLDVPVYSLTEAGKVEIQMGRRPRCTEESAPLVEVVLDDGSSLRVTPDHKMRLLDGTTCEAQELQPGDSLPRFTHEHSEETRRESGPAVTDLETFWIEERKFVVRVCENCGDNFPVPWGKRERSYCSSSCGNQKASSAKVRKKGQALFFGDQQRQVLHEQVTTYSKLIEDLGRKPLEKEWEAACGEKGTPVQMWSKGTTKNPHALTGYKHLQQVADGYNHRVVEVRELTCQEPVFNLTVDKNHTMGIVTSVDKKRFSGVFSTNCGEQPLEDRELCVCGDTPLQHRRGVQKIRDLVGEQVDIWNGDSWSTVTPRVTGEGGELLRVHLSDGSYLDCTKHHGWHVKPPGKRVFRRVETGDLVKGSQAAPFSIDAPIEGGHQPHAFEWGLFAGDGYLNRNGNKTYPMVIICGGKAALQDLAVQGTWYKPQVKEGYAEPVNRLNLHKFLPLSVAELLRSKTTGLPPDIFGMDRESLLEFLAGWIEADGSIINRGLNAEGFRLYGSEAKIRDAQLLLRRVGIDHSTVRLFAEEGEETNFGVRNYDLYYVQIPSYECSEIPTRLKILNSFGSRYATNNAHPAGLPIDRARKQKVVRVEELPGTHTTYCFDEPDNHMGVFGNALTYQCNLVETFPAHHDSFKDYQKTLKMAYLYAKTVTLIPTHDPRANAVMMRNRRIGCSMSGIQQAIKKLGRREFLTWCDRGYAYLKELDLMYSEWLCIPRSIKMSSIKPSGTVSLLAGATPGVHHAHSEFYIRNIRVKNTSPLIQVAKDAGHTVEPDVYADDTTVVSFPVQTPDFDRGKREVSIWEQFADAAAMQKHWADNQVSCSISFSADEAQHIVRCLEVYEDQLKSISLIPLKDHGYKQAPYIEIDAATYKRLMASIRPMDLSDAQHEVTDKWCDGDKCELDPTAGSKIRK